MDAASGGLLWRTKVDEHEAATLTGSPVLFEGRIYLGISSIEEFTGAFPTYPCCTFRGSLAAYDASNGERLWKTYTIPEGPEPRRPNARGVMQHGPSGAAIWSAPTIDASLRRVYVTTGDNYSDPPTDDSDSIIAFDLDTGTRLWSRQFTPNDAYNMGCNPRTDRVNCPEADGPDFDFGASAMLVQLDAGARLLVAGQKSGMVHAVDPDREGEIVWQRKAGEGGKLGGIQFGTGADSRHAYVAVSDYRGSRPGPAGGIAAVRLSDGAAVWRRSGTPCPRGRPRCSPAQSAAVTVIPGVVFSGSLDGHLRAYSTQDGTVLWDYDSVRDYPNTVNGVPAKGGSLNGPGAVVVDGMVFVNSGYGTVRLDARKRAPRICGRAALSSRRSRRFDVRAAAHGVTCRWGLRFSLWPSERSRTQASRLRGPRQLRYSTESRLSCLTKARRCPPWLRPIPSASESL